MSIIIDFEGFQQPSDEGASEFVLKELAAIYLNVIGESSEQLTYIIFSPPSSLEDLPNAYKKINIWHERNLHGMIWEEQGVDYKEIGYVFDFLLIGVTRIYVRGSAKEKFLSKFIDERKSIINLEDFGCPEIEKLNEHPTYYHSEYRTGCSNYVCASENVQKLEKYFVKNFTLQPNLNKSIRLFSVGDGLNNMMWEDIELLPAELITKFAKHQIDDNWNKLSLEHKQNKANADCRK